MTSPRRVLEAFWRSLRPGARQSDASAEAPEVLSSRGDPARDRALLRDFLDAARLYGLDAAPAGDGELRIVGRTPGRSIRITRQPLQVRFVGFDDPVRVAGITVPLDLGQEREALLAAFAEKVFRLLQAETTAEELMAVIRELDLTVSHPDRRTALVSGRARDRSILFAATGVVDKIELHGDWADTGIGVLPDPGALARDDRWLLNPAGTPVQLLARFGSAARLCVDDPGHRRRRDRDRAGTKRT